MTGVVINDHLKHNASGYPITAKSYSSSHCKCPHFIQHHIYHWQQLKVSASLKAPRVFPLKWDICHLENKNCGKSWTTAGWTLESLPFFFLFLSDVAFSQYNAVLPCWWPSFLDWSHWWPVLFFTFDHSFSVLLWSFILVRVKKACS